MERSQRAALKRMLHRRRIAARLLAALPAGIAALSLLGSRLSGRTVCPLTLRLACLLGFLLLTPLAETLRTAWLLRRILGAPLRLRARQWAAAYAVAAQLLLRRLAIHCAALLPAGVLLAALLLRYRSGNAALPSLWIDWAGCAGLAAGGLIFSEHLRCRLEAALPVALLHPGITARQAIAESRRRTRGLCGDLLLHRLRPGPGGAGYFLYLYTYYSA